MSKVLKSQGLREIWLRLFWNSSAGTHVLLEEPADEIPPISLPSTQNSPKYHAKEVNSTCLPEGYWCCNLATEKNYLGCGGIHSLLGENRKIHSGFSAFLTLFKWNAVTKSHVSGFQPAGLGKDLLFAFLWGTRFFPAGDMTLEIGQCLDVVLKILFLQRTGWSKWFD